MSRLSLTDTIIIKLSFREIIKPPDLRARQLDGYTNIEGAWTHAQSARLAFFFLGVFFLGLVRNIFVIITETEKYQ